MFKLQADLRSDTFGQRRRCRQRSPQDVTGDALTCLLDHVSANHTISLAPETVTIDGAFSSAAIEKEPSGSCSTMFQRGWRFERRRTERERLASAVLAAVKGPFVVSLVQ
jgi:hypothetical protein